MSFALGILVGFALGVGLTVAAIVAWAVIDRRNEAGKWEEPIG